MAQVLDKSSDLGNDDRVILDGKLIQEHLENVNMDAWYRVHQVHAAPQKEE